MFFREGLLGSGDLGAGAGTDVGASARAGGVSSGATAAIAPADGLTLPVETDCQSSRPRSLPGTGGSGGRGPANTFSGGFFAPVTGSGVGGEMGDIGRSAVASIAPGTSNLTLGAGMSSTNSSGGRAGLARGM